MHVLDHFHDRVLVPDLEQEAQNARAEVEIGKQHSGVRHARQGAAQIEGHGGRAGTGLGRKEGINPALGRVERRLLFHQRLYVPQRLDQGAELERLGHQFTHSGAHDLPERRRVAVPVIGDELNAFHLLGHALDHFHGEIAFFKTEEDDFRSVCAERPNQLAFVRIVEQNAADR